MWWQLKFFIDKPFDLDMRDFKINEDQIQQTIESPDRTTRIDLNQDERDLRGIYPTGKNVFINIHLKKFKID